MRRLESVAAPLLVLAALACHSVSDGPPVRATPPPLPASPQPEGWEVLAGSPSSPANARHDDIVFVDESNGWLVNGRAEVWNTEDGGSGWRQLAQLPPDVVLRCVGFTSLQKGGAGNLNFTNPETVRPSYALWETLDGGRSWSNISERISGPPVAGLCGMQVLSPSVIVAVGRWSGPPVFVKSTDGGASWTSRSLAPLASGLVDVFFFNELEGFAVGGLGDGPTDAEQRASRTVIVSTSDGGETWQTRYISAVAGQRGWKIHFPGANVGYVTTEGTTPEGVIVKTSDRGGLLAAGLGERRTLVRGRRVRRSGSGMGGQRRQPVLDGRRRRQLEAPVLRPCDQPHPRRKRLAGLRLRRPRVPLAPLGRKIVFPERVKGDRLESRNGFSPKSLQARGPMKPRPKGERRQELRVDLPLLVRVEGYQSDRTSWTELTTTRNASASGISFAVEHRLLVGQVVKLRLMLPFAGEQPQKPPAYGVYAVVRDVLPENGVSRVGAMFFGEQPPKDFDRNPAALYLLPWDVSPEGWRDLVARAEDAGTARPSRPPLTSDRRVFPRFEISVNFLVQHVDEWEEILEEGLTVAENLSRGGARLLTTATLGRGDIVILREIGGTFITRAEVTGFDYDNDGSRHVRVRFLGPQGPDHLIPGG